MIIGITGTNGSGKGTVVGYFVNKGFKHYSGIDFILEEIRKRGLPENRDSMHLVGNDLRKKYHPAYLMELMYVRAQEVGGDTVMEAPRAIAEGQFLKDRHVPLVAVDADRKIRYERISRRGNEKDKVSFEKFCEQEEKELNATEAHEMNIVGVMKMADYTVTNNARIEELYAQLDTVLKQITE
jgi:dephospho-CoA kinase